jgi:predicted outer membrane repeat protein
VDYFKFYNYNGQPNPDDQHLSIRNPAGGTLNWKATDDSFWLSTFPESGTSTGETDVVAISVDTTTLPHGEYTGVITISDANSINVFREIIVKLFIADEVRVPDTYPTIQSAINAVGDRSTVIVADGTYTGNGNTNINFNGKAITVRSENGPDNCIIDCQNMKRGVIFNTYEENDSILDGFTVINGSASSDNGGGICITDSSPTIINCKIMNCHSSIWGGGIFCENGSPLISRCLVSDNSSSNDGGGIFCFRSTPAIIENCRIINNSARKYGGGIACQNDNGYYATIRNCLIAGNSTRNLGGGIYLTSTSTKIYNCTIVDNSCTNSGGAIYYKCTDRRNPVLANSILWGNSPDQIYMYYTGPTIKYNNIQGGWSGSGNIDIDPQFINAVGGDYHLQFGSACFDAGDNSVVIELNDIDGHERIVDGDCAGSATVDMGAYEFDWLYGGDLTDECGVGPGDLAILAQNWLTNNPAVDIAPYPVPDGIINLLDFAVLARNWLKFKDIARPTPDLMTWEEVPAATGTNSIVMTASVATDTDNGVEYNFICTAGGGHDSGWQSETYYEDTGLTHDTTYTYTVTARDTSYNHNETSPSTAESATTGPDTVPPVPDPMTWTVVPYPTSSTSIMMVATTASDPSGVEYFFTCTVGAGNDSSWQDSATYEDTGLAVSTEYTYTVTARDKSGAQNTTATSAPASATTNFQNLVLPASGGLLESFTSEYGSGYVAANLTNENTNEHGWASTDNPSPPQEFVYSFSGTQDATLEVAVLHGGLAAGIYYSKDVEVWTSADGSSFTLAGSGTLLEQDNDSVTIPLGGVTAKKVKLSIASGYNTLYWSLAEFEVFGKITE